MYPSLCPGRQRENYQYINQVRQVNNIHHAWIPAQEDIKMFPHSADWNMEVFLQIYPFSDRADILNKEQDGNTEALYTQSDITQK